ncbi:hypothetical protein ACJDU8_21825 [Clostridium sp. WILCCON 0269]|uniref:Uncharacterized protein n=1 Tax=Candidatus Clostridium eludens TaxID=3381663 RepID=A0ABW8SQH4_9CLOT
MIEVCLIVESQNAAETGLTALQTPYDEVQQLINRMSARGNWKSNSSEIYQYL